MNKKIILPALALSFILPVQAFASETETTRQTEQTLTEAGLTPDSLFYSVDKLGESIELAMADDGVEEATVLEEIAEERMAEVAEMVEEGNTELVAPTLEEYKDTLTELTNELDTAIENGEDVTKVVEAIAETEEVTKEIMGDAVETLPEGEQDTISEAIEETKEQLGETTETVEAVEEGESTEKDSLKKQVATEILLAKVGEEALKQSQDNQLGERQILAIQSLAEKSGKSFEEVLKVFLENDKGIGETAKALGLKPNEVMKSINQDFKDTKKEVKENLKETKKRTPSIKKETVEQEQTVESKQSTVQTTDVQKKEEGKVMPSKQPEIKKPSVSHEEKPKGKQEEKKEKPQPKADKKEEDKAVKKPQKQEAKPEKKPEEKPVENKATSPTEVSAPKAETPKAQTPQPSKEKEQDNKEKGKGNGNGQGKGNGQN